MKKPWYKRLFCMHRHYSEKHVVPRGCADPACAACKDLGSYYWRTCLDCGAEGRDIGESFS